jgi:dienelactone hydrolase
MTQVIEMGIADAQQALRIVRKNAANWGIDPSKVGMLGYSAGGGVAIGAAVTDAPGAQPDFIISAYGPSLVDVNVPDEPPPIFLAVKQYHPNVARALVALYEEWTNAGAPAELHIYDQLGPVPFLEDTGEWLGQAYVWMTKRDFAPQAPTAAEVDDAALPAAEGGDRQ